MIVVVNILAVIYVIKMIILRVTVLKAGVSDVKRCHITSRIVLMFIDVGFVCVKASQPEIAVVE